jgi:hypothetical protein
MATSRVSWADSRGTDTDDVGWMNEARRGSWEAEIGVRVVGLRPVTGEALSKRVRPPQPSWLQPELAQPSQSPSCGNDFNANLKGGTSESSS